MRSHFITDLKLRPLPDGKRWRLLGNLVYHSGRYGTIVVPECFTTDLASIPQVFWGILSPLAEHERAAVIHDYLYTQQKRSRRQCDVIFLEAMKVCGTGWLKRSVIYWMVRLFGGIAWKKRRR